MRSIDLNKLPLDPSDYETVRDMLRSDQAPDAAGILFDLLTKDEAFARWYGNGMRAE